MTNKTKSAKPGGDAGSRKKSPVAEVRTGLPQMMRSASAKSSGKSPQAAKNKNAEPLRGGGAKKKK